MISFVYFDVGGVAIRDLSGTDGWTEIKRQWGIKAEDGVRFDEFWDLCEKELCLGREINSLIPEMNRSFNLQISTDRDLLLDFVDRFRENKIIWPIFDEINRSCKTGLLTNMYPRMLEMIKYRGLLPKVTWEVIIDSSVVGLQKPDPKIYKLAEDKAGVSGDKILFVDNTAENLATAKKFGWQTVLYDSQKPEEAIKAIISGVKGM